MTRATKRLIRASAAAAATAAFLSSGVQADTKGAHCHTVGAAASAKLSVVSAIPNVKVKTQDGRTLDFYDDLIKGKVVAVNFVFTTCTTVCPPMGALFGNLQERNRHRLGKDLHLVSVSIDPVVDTPERLKAWGAKFGARPGWTLVTGDKDDITRLMKAMNAYTSNPQNHQPVTLIGNDATGEWKRSYGFTSAAKLTAMVEEVR